MMQQHIFITGTDTNVGKTYVTAGLLRALHKRGLATLGVKPIASGAQKIHNELKSDDALALHAASSIKMSYHQINPFVFEPPISPNIAADMSKAALTLEKINEKCQHALNYPADICLIEGAGGWHVPLNHHETLADFVTYHRLPVILVVGIRLGCINHAILTENAIQRSASHLIGWIGNKIDTTTIYTDEIITTLRSHLTAPCLGIVEHNSSVESIVNIDFLDAVSNNNHTRSVVSPEANALITPSGKRISK